MFIFFLSLCVMMAQIATCSIAERTHIDNYLFFSFINSGFIFPVGLAWCWNNGWLQNYGFIDNSGASFVHTMGGLAGFIGTYIIGPREGLFKRDQKLAYILEESKLLDDSDSEDEDKLDQDS
jgi:Amt family ammonium transporter